MKRAVLTSLFFLGLVTVSAPARAATFSPACGNAGQLVAAIAAANTNGEDDVIALGGSCTYQLTSVNDSTFGPTGLPPITADDGKRLRIVGDRARIERPAAAPSFRLITVAGGALELEGLTLAGGHAANDGSFFDGGGVRVQSGTLDAVNVSFTGNTAGDGGYGGALALKVGASAHLQRCGVFQNHAEVGGGIFNDGGTLTVGNTTVSGNDALTFGGGIGMRDGSTSLRNVTVVENIADLAQGAIAEGDGGGLANFAGAFSLVNTIVARNTDASVGPTDNRYPDVAGTFSDGGHNLIGDASGSVGFAMSALLGTAALPLDPQLAAAASNDGDTGSHVPLAGSPAVNAGDSATCADAPISGVDQGGRPRPAGHCDIGSHELRSTATLVLTAEPASAALGTRVTLSCALALAPLGPSFVGPIVFEEDGAEIGAVVGGDEGVAAIDLDGLGPGLHRFRCAYAGDPSIVTARSAEAEVTVGDSGDPGIDLPPLPFPFPSIEPPGAQPPPNAADAGAASAPGSPEGEGCGCRHARPAPWGGAPLVVLAATAAVVLRRRRR